MSTTVLITSSPTVSSRLVHGEVAERRPHPHGAVLVLPPGEIAFYELRTVKCRTFVFRTVALSESFTSEVPGVRPAVRLLLETRTRGRLARLEELLRYLARKGLPPSALSDAFYLRLHALLNGRLPPSGKVIRSLLEQEGRGAHAA